MVGDISLQRIARPVLLPIMGVPRGYPLTEHTAPVVERMVESIFPVAPRSRGVIFDAFTSNPAVNNYPLKEVEVPTLVVHASDDPAASYPAARNAAERIPGARLVTLERGGHLMLGQDEVVRRALDEFLSDHELKRPLHA